MIDENSEKLSDRDKEALQWITGPYFGGLYALLDSNRNYLNQGITWSIGLLTAVIIFVLTYIAPLQEIKDPSGGNASRSFVAVLNNITDADILLIATVFSLSFAFVSNFLSRSIKGYLNLLRYASLYSHCLRLASGSDPVTLVALHKLVGHIRQYDDDFCPPLTLGTVVGKMLKELGYGLFFFILVVADIVAVITWYTAATTISTCLFWFIVALGPFWLAIELFLLRHSSYYRYGAYPVESWPEALQRK